MASFVYRSDAQMMVHEMMMHPGMSMNEPVQASHLAVGFLVHLAFSIVVGVAFAFVILIATRALRLQLLTTRYGYVGAAVIGGLILYALMMYLVLPAPIGANPVIPEMTPRGAFIIGHVLYGITFGLVAFALLRPTLAAPMRRAAA
jgi:hypothetical protein